MYRYVCVCMCTVHFSSPRTDTAQEKREEVEDGRGLCVYLSVYLEREIWRDLAMVVLSIEANVETCRKEERKEEEGGEERLLTKEGVMTETDDPKHESAAVRGSFPYSVLLTGGV